MLMMTGRGPVNRDGGRYITPEIIRPSKLFQRTISGSGKVPASMPPTGLFVQRLIAPVAAFMLKTSAEMRDEPKLNATSVPSALHCKVHTPRGVTGAGSCPAGSGAVRTVCDVIVSIISTRLEPSRSTLSARVLPSGESASASTESPSRLIEVHLPLRRRHARGNSEPWLLIA